MCLNRVFYLKLFKVSTHAQSHAFIQTSLINIIVIVWRTRRS